ncbi:hypothetical protein FUMI01_00330 [Flavobacterium sp. UMI-01]|nr:hypothetical protein FUMI01_00330 [Flavobacterium sp. UMI-01]
MATIPADFTTTTAYIANYIQANFKTDEDKLRAVFYWTTTNIHYDVKNMMAPNTVATSQERINKTLKSHKGVCIDYAEVFHAIATDLGLKNYIIEGFTKQGGKVSAIAHAWCAVQLNGKWYLVDPTWGAGGVQNGIFVKKLNNQFYKVAPEKMVASHLPFDYLWQFLQNPITFETFVSGKIQQPPLKRDFDFNKEILRYNTLSETDKSIETIARIEENKFSSSPVIASYLSVLKKNAALQRQNTAVEKMNAVVANYNQAIVFLNDFIFYRNKKFKPAVPDEQLERMVKEANERLVQCQNEVYTVGAVGPENSANLSNLKSQINLALKNSEEQLQFVQEYLKKSKLGRKMMFSQLTLMGVPLR